MSKVLISLVSFLAVILSSTVQALTLQVTTDPNKSHCTSIWALQPTKGDQIHSKLSKRVPDGIYKLVSSPTATCSFGTFGILSDFSSATFYQGEVNLVYVSSDKVTCYLKGKDDGENLISGSYTCNNANYPLPWNAVVLPS